MSPEDSETTDSGPSGEQGFGTPEEVRFLLSPESRVSDCLALMNSYAVEVAKEDLLHIRTPLFFCKMGGVEIKRAEEFYIPVIDRQIDLRLCRSAPPTEDDPPKEEQRWPFFVNDPLTIVLSIGDQWWEYKFSPGKLYEDRRMDYATAR